MKTLSGLLLLFVLPASSPAWGEDGHRIVARIAERHLTAPARAGIRELLGDRAITDKDVCLWPDIIRGQAAYKTKYPDNATWHYINLEVNDPAPDPVQACVNDNCVLGAIDRFRKVLKDRSAAELERREALYFLVHFVGDLHQPLHCGSRNDDKGGNRLRAQYLNEKPKDGDRPLNLHWVWDENLVKAAEAGLGWEDFAARLDSRIAAADLAAWQTTDVKAWIIESHVHAKKSVYAPIPADWPLDGKPFAIDDAYVKASKPVVEAQLQRAGVRLAKVLNDVFAD